MARSQSSMLRNRGGRGGVLVRGDEAAPSLARLKYCFSSTPPRRDYQRLGCFQIETRHSILSALHVGREYLRRRRNWIVQRSKRRERERGKAWTNKQQAEFDLSIFVRLEKRSNRWGDKRGKSKRPYLRSGGNREKKGV